MKSHFTSISNFFHVSLCVAEPRKKMYSSLFPLQIKIYLCNSYLLVPSYVNFFFFFDDGTCVRYKNGLKMNVFLKEAEAQKIHGVNK